jgi:hypothetical protein
VLWSGAEYRGRGRQTNWIGRARFEGSAITRFEPINRWNHERLLQQSGSDTVEWNTLTTGNFAGFDAWLDEDLLGTLDIATNHGALRMSMAEIGIDDTVMEAGGLARRIRVFRLPKHNPHRGMRRTVTVPLHPTGDNPLWVSVFTEDGFQAWSSPIFMFR